MIGRETIEWRLAEDIQPEDQVMVLLHVPDNEEFPVWPGYHDGDAWRWAGGAVIEDDVIEWAEMPVGSSVDDPDSELWKDEHASCVDDPDSEFWKDEHAS